MKKIEETLLLTQEDFRKGTLTWPPKHTCLKRAPLEAFQCANLVLFVGSDPYIMKNRYGYTGRVISDSLHDQLAEWLKT